MTTTAEKIAIMQAYVDGKTIEVRMRKYSDRYEWLHITVPSWDWSNCAYRVKPEPPKTPDYINWDHVGPELNYMARDLRKDKIFLYSTKPTLTTDEWGTSGFAFTAQHFASLKQGTVDWKDSLVARPGYEVK